MSVEVLIPFRDSGTRRGRNLTWCEARWRALFPGISIRVGPSPKGPFNRSAALNAARLMVADDCKVLIIADADTHGDAAALAYAVNQCVENDTAPWFLPYNRYYNLTDGCSQMILSMSPGATIEESSFEFEHRIPSPPVPPYGDPVSGILVMPINAYNLVGGFDADFKGWGYEDRDMADRLDLLWGPRKRMDAYVFHLWHPVDPGSTFESEECKLNEKRYRENAHGYSRTGH